NQVGHLHVTARLPCSRTTKPLVAGCKQKVPKARYKTAKKDIGGPDRKCRARNARGKHVVPWPDDLLPWRHPDGPIDRAGLLKPELHGRPPRRLRFFPACGVCGRQGPRITVAAAIFCGFAGLV